jgi:katanin p60 ATPase-containing subunit A1
VLEQDLEERELLFPSGCLQAEESRDLLLWLARDVVSAAATDPATWDAVVGHAAAKQSLEECVLYPLRYPALFRRLRRSQMFANSVSSILLFGPPGTGKTMLARAVAARFNTTFFNVRCSSLASKWRGDSEKLIRLLFQLARANAPATIFLDEADAFLSERGASSEHEASRRCKAELLVQLDGLESRNGGGGGGADGDAESAGDTILFLASTNLPWTLDPAVLRRFHKRILVHLPEEEERLGILTSCLRTEATNPPGREQLSRLARDTKNYSGSDLTMVCREATLAALRAAPADSSRLDITLELLLQAKERVKPTTLNQKMFTDWNEKFGSY